MWKFVFVMIIFLSWSASGQVQYHREVAYPSGPSQLLARRSRQVALAYAPQVPHQQFAHFPQQPIQFSHQPQQLFQYTGQPTQFAYQPQQLIHYAEQPTQYVQYPQQFVNYAAQPTQYIQNPQQVAQYIGQPTQYLQNPQQLVQYVGQPTQILHQAQQFVQISQPLASSVPVTSPVFGYDIQAHPQPVYPGAPEIHVEKHLIPAALSPVLVKEALPVIEKPVVPEVTLIQQPILSKALFQRHIYNVKHGSEPIIVQDLCTVYPYQKNLRSCVLKKATLPELHHPDIRTVNVQASKHQTAQSVIAPAPPTPRPSAMVIVAKPKNIQDTIRRESARVNAAATNKSETVTIVIPPVASSTHLEMIKPRKSLRTEKSRRKKSKGSTSRHHFTTEKPFKLAKNK